MAKVPNHQCNPAIEGSLKRSDPVRLDAAMRYLGAA